MAHRVATCPRPSTGSGPSPRRVRGRGSAAHASLQFAARHLVLIAPVVDRRPLPGVRSVLVSYAVRGSFRCGSGVLVRRCAAWALRACGFAVEAVRVAADRSRAADRARAKPVAKHGVRALPAGSDDLTKLAGSTTSAAEPQSAGVDSKT